MAAAVQSRASHVGLCVRDLDASRRFYVDGLGFKEFTRFELTRQLAEMDAPCHVIACVIDIEGLRIELLHFPELGTFGAPATRRNELGLTHLNFIVEDVDAAARELEKFGGKIIENTRFGEDDPSAVQIIFLEDPDGNRVELMRLAEGQEW